MGSRLALGVLAAIALAVATLGLAQTSRAQGGGSPDFAIAVDGLAGCDTRGGNATCDVAAGGTFVVDVILDGLPDGVSNYTGIDLLVQADGVTQQGDPDTSPWPDCAFAVMSLPRPEGLLFGCATGLPPAGPSTYTGVIATIAYTCAESGRVALVHGEGFTAITTVTGEAFLTSSETGADQLSINCVAGAPLPSTPTAPLNGGARIGEPIEDLTPGQASGTATAPATGATQPQETAGATPTGTIVGEEDDDGGVNGMVIAIIIVVAVAAAGGLGFAGWRYLQGRGGTSGGT